MDVSVMTSNLMPGFGILEQYDDEQYGVRRGEAVYICYRGYGQNLMCEKSMLGIKQSPYGIKISYLYFISPTFYI